jgi:hypothetical protein
MESRFEELFPADHDAAYTYPGLRWEFARSDLNKSARDLLAHLDRMFGILEVETHMFLTTIELDVEPGRFPEVLLQYFWDEATGDDDAVFVAPIRGVHSIGRITFETRIGQLGRVLRYDGGWRWGAYLRVWGFQVRKELLNTVIELSPFDSGARTNLDALRDSSRAAWVTSRDLDALALWLEGSSKSDIADASKRLRSLTA